MFVNFLMATNVFDMPASLFCRYLEFFDIVNATPMQTWEGGTRNIYEKLTEDFRDKIFLVGPCARCSVARMKSSSKTRRERAKPLTRSSSPATPTRP